jgi:threonine dehydratase
MTDNSGYKMSAMRLTVDGIRAARQRLGHLVSITPVQHWRGREIRALMGQDTEVYLKLELFQQTGTFKARGALTVMMNLTAEQMRPGVTAFSGGNHAIAVAYAAQCLGVNAHVVMQRSANWLRVAKARAYGATVEMAEDGRAAKTRADELARTEGRAFIHPFEDPSTVLGTATLGLEWLEQTRELDAVIVAIGGGGLMAGVSSAIRLVSPSTQILGVEPEGADVMQRSFALGTAGPLTFALCRRNVDRLVTVSDQEIREAMALLFFDANLAVEPAGAAATAALVGPLREELRGRRVGVLVCGSVIDSATFHQHIQASGKSIPFS